MTHDTRRLGTEELLAHAVGLRRLAVGLVGDGAADDLVQDTLLAGIERPPREHGSLWPWLQRVMHNLARLRWRGEDRRTRREVVAARTEALPSARELVERMDLQRVVAEEVLNLPEPYRGAVLAFYFDGVRAEEHARRRGIPSATVRSQLKRGLDLLRERLDARVDERSRGDRSAWSAALLGLARRASQPAPLEPLAPTVLASKLGVGIAAALVATLGLVAWWWVPSPARAPMSMSGASTASIVSGSSELDPGAPEAAVPSARAAQGDAPRVALATSVASRGTVTGIVTAGAKGPGVSGIGVGLLRDGSDVRLDPPPLAESDEKGQFRFADVVPGVYGVQLDRCNPRVTIVVEAGKTTNAALVVSGIEFVRGHVFDDTDRPVAGAEIWVYEPSRSFGRAIALTDEHGAYVVNWIGPQCGMGARKPGYVSSGTMHGTPESPLASRDFYLVRGGGGVRGRVVDPDGTPVSGVPVWCSPPQGQGVNRSGTATSAPAAEKRVTDAEGEFEFESRPAGSNLLSVRAHGFAPILEQVGITEGRTASVRFELARPVVVTGTVRNSNGRPLGRVQLSCKSGNGNVYEDVRSEDDGTFRITHVAPGRCRLTASAFEHESVHASFVLGPGDNSWNPTLVRCIPLRGRAIDEQGQGVPFLGVQAFPPPERNSTVQTDVNGWFEFPAVRDVPTDLMLVQDSLVPPVIWTTLSGVRPSDPNIVLRKGAAASITVRGKLLDAAGQRVPDYHVSCIQDAGVSASAVTNVKGKFVLSRLVPGHALIRASQSGNGWFGQVLASIELVPGADIDLGAITIAGTGALHVRVRGVDGAPIEWISGALYAIDAPTAAVSTLRWDGRDKIEVEGVTAGKYRLCVKGPGCCSVHQLVEIEAGRDNEAEVVLRPGVQVRMLVTWPTGPCASRSLTLVVRDEHEAIVDLHRPYGVSPLQDVEYVTTLAPGRYTLEATTADGLSAKGAVDVQATRPSADWVELALH